MTTVSILSAVATLSVSVALLSVADAAANDVIPLKDAKLIVEHNATDNDTGFQMFVDGEGWQRLVVKGPEGEVLKLDGLGKLGNLGLTELFLETVEPAQKDMPIDKVLSVLPEGKYTFEGPAMEAGEAQGVTRGRAVLCHGVCVRSFRDWVARSCRGGYHLCVVGNAGYAARTGRSSK